MNIKGVTLLLAVTTAAAALLCYTYSSDDQRSHSEDAESEHLKRPDSSTASSKTTKVNADEHKEVESNSRSRLEEFGRLMDAYIASAIDGEKQAALELSSRITVRFEDVFVEWTLQRIDYESTSGALKFNSITPYVSLLSRSDELETFKLCANAVIERWDSSDSDNASRVREFKSLNASEPLSMLSAKALTTEDLIYSSTVTAIVALEHKHGTQNRPALACFMELLKAELLNESSLIDPWVSSILDYSTFLEAKAAFASLREPLLDARVKPRTRRQIQEYFDIPNGELWASLESILQYNDNSVLGKMLGDRFSGLLLGSANGVSQKALLDEFVLIYEVLLSRTDMTKTGLVMSRTAWNALRKGAASVPDHQVTTAYQTLAEELASRLAHSNGVDTATANLILLKAVVEAGARLTYPYSSESYFRPGTSSIVETDRKISGPVIPNLTTEKLELILPALSREVGTGRIQGNKPLNNTKAVHIIAFSGMSLHDTFEYSTKLVNTFTEQKLATKKTHHREALHHFPGEIAISTRHIRLRSIELGLDLSASPLREGVLDYTKSVFLALESMSKDFKLKAWSSSFDDLSYLAWELYLLIRATAPDRPSCIESHSGYLRRLAEAAKVHTNTRMEGATHELEIAYRLQLEEAITEVLLYCPAATEKTDE